jgi:hypothetical protein
MLGTSLPIRCTNCHDKQLMCKAHPHTKGLCYHCIVNGLSCFFLPKTILRHGSTRMNKRFVFSAIAFIAHKVTKNVYLIPILHCNANVVYNSRFHVYSSYHPKATVMIWMPQLIPKTWRRCWSAEVPNWMAHILHQNLWILMGAHSPPKPLYPNGRSVNANESVDYHHCSNGYSCHGRVEPVTILI